MNTYMQRPVSAILMIKSPAPRSEAWAACTETPQPTGRQFLRGVQLGVTHTYHVSPTGWGNRKSLAEAGPAPSMAGARAKLDHTCRKKRKNNLGHTTAPLYPGGIPRKATVEA